MTAPETDAVPRSTRRRTITITTLTLGVLCGGGVAAAVVATSADASGTSGSTAPAASSGSASGSGSTTTCMTGNDIDGVVTSAGSSSLTVRDLLGTSRTYAITSTTTVHHGTTKVDASTLEKGDRVHVRGTKSGSTYTATDVDLRPAAIDGSVTALTATSITVTDRDGFTRTIGTDGSTTYTSAGKSVTRSAFISGTAVHAEGSVDPDGTTLDADSVAKLTAGAGPDGSEPTPPKVGSKPVAPKDGTKPAAPAGGPACGPGAGDPGGHGPGGGGPAGAPAGGPKGSAPSGAPKGKPSAPAEPSGTSSAPSTPSPSAS